METLEVVLKLSERCNIDCSYCYVFHGRDDSYLHHPKSISAHTIKDVARFLASAAQSSGIRTVQIDFHGGEPLLVGRKRFGEICDMFLEITGPATDLRFAIQTNATLVDQAWVDIFERYRVSPGVSLDGPREVHDRNRKDFRARGTYDRTVRGLQLLLDAKRQGRLESVGVLAVVQPQFNGGLVYRHLTKDIGADLLDLLMPDVTHESAGQPDDGQVGRFLCEAFDAWYEDDDPTITVRILESVMSLLLGGRSRMIGFGGEMPAAITIASDGSLGPDDTLRSCGSAMFNQGFNVQTTAFSSFLASPMMRQISGAGSRLPDDCQECCWKRICGGGHLIHRYRAGAFDEPSFFCDSLRVIYGHVANTLVHSSEATMEELEARLAHERTPGPST